MRLTLTFKWFMAVALMLMATTVFAQPSNDACSGAIALDCGDAVTGSTTGATADEVPSCAPQTTGPSVWYTVTGTGGEITVSTCSSVTDYNTQLAIYAGSCTNLVCIDGNNVDYTCAAGARNSTVTFMSLAGATYYIYVTGQGGANGLFELSVDCLAPPIDNDDCVDAESISCGDVVIGSTAGASNASLPFCGTSLGVGPGVWYEFTGNGSTVTVTTCGAATNFDTKLGVFSGSCGSLVCVGGDDDEFGTCSFSGLQSRVTFASTSGVTYYFYVTGFLSNAGDFELSVTCEAAATNDDACDAAPLSMGATPFDLTTASVQSGEPSPGPGTTGASCNSTDGWCSFETDVDASLWYTFVAPESGCVDIVLDGGDSQMAIWSVGDCSNFSTYTEVFANDDGGPGLAAGLEDMLLTPGETYYLQVDDFGGGPTFASGNIFFSEGDGCEIPPPAQPTCETAVDIDCGDEISGSTSGAPTNELGDCNGEDLSEAEGVWYAVQGNGLKYIIETQEEGTDYDPVIGVFSGTCSALSCITANNNATLTTRMARVEWISTPGETYYVYITGQRGSDGNFLFTLECTAPNDDCADAIAVDCNSSVGGSTSLATADVFPACGEGDFGSAGVWYSFTGSGTETTVSTCNAGTTYDTKLFLFEGTCGSLVCIDGNDDDFGCSFSILRSTITFNSDEETTYYVLVTGFNSFSSGDFVLSVSCAAPPTGDGCDISSNDGIYDDVCDADCLTLGVGYAFSNAGATAQPGEINPGPGTGAGATCNAVNGWCNVGDEPEADNSVWFRFEAPASGCVDVGAIDADLQIAVYSVGDCADFGSFIEIGANDDSGPGFSPFLDNLAVTPGELYYVQVDGYNGALETAGTVTVSDCSAPIPGCADAIELFCGDVITGSTVNASTITDLPTCGTALNTAPGVFYKHTGIGQTVTLSTCNPAVTNYDTKIGVFTGGCNLATLTCVAGNDDACPGFRSEVSFFAASGVEYIIYVTGFGGANGDYELVLSCTNNITVDPGDYGNTTIADALDVELEVGNPYPNPTQTGQATIDIKLPTEGTSHIRIFDQLGRLMQQTEVDMFAGTNRIDLDVANLTAGTYFVNITIDGQQFMKKLAVVR